MKIARKFLGVLLVATIALTPMDSATAANKVGATCTKVGATASAGIVKLVCAKVGKSLVWQKKSTATAKPAPIKPTSPAVPAVKTQAQVISENCSSLPKDTPSALTLLCSIENDKVAAASLSAIRAQGATKRTSSASLTLESSPQLEKYRAELTHMIETIMGFHGEDFRSKSVFVSLFAPADVDAAEKSFLSRHLTDNPLAQWNLVRTQEHWGGCGGQATSSITADRSNFIFVACLSPAKYETAAARELLSHEFFHLVQQSHFVDLDWDHPRTNLPHWVAEGNATLLEEFNQTVDVPVFYHKIWPSNTAVQDAILSGDPKKVTALYKSVEPKSIGGPEASVKSYLLGGLASELLMAVFGYEKFRSFSNNFATDPSIENAFMKTYGFTAVEFYTRMASYLKWWSSTSQYKRS